VLADTVRRRADQRDFFMLLFFLGGEKRDVREVAGSNETNRNESIRGL
jgi:hypothetical protein